MSVATRCLSGSRGTGMTREGPPRSRTAANALGERQALLLGPDTPAARARIDALGLRVADLLEEIAGVQPPAAALEDEAAAPGEFDGFLHRGDPERPAG
jgi:hypothetical protein